MSTRQQAIEDAAKAAARTFWPGEPESMYEELDASGLAVLAAVEPLIRAELSARHVLSAAFACGSEDCPRPFALYRHQDVTGASGTGTVAHGVQFADGTVVVRWTAQPPSTVVWDSLDDAMKVHGHDGKTELVWLAAEFSEMAKAEDEARADQREQDAQLADLHEAYTTQQDEHDEYRRVTLAPFGGLLRAQP